MFGNNNNNKKETTKSSSSLPSSSLHSHNSLVQGTTVEGTVRSKSDIRIDGSIKGKLICDAKVIIGPTGFVNGEIKCKNAVIEGKFDGNLQVSELLNIRDSANVNGDISTNKLIVQSGATFNGTCTMDGGKPMIKKEPIHTSANTKTVPKVVQETKAKPAGV